MMSSTATTEEAISLDASQLNPQSWAGEVISARLSHALKGQTYADLARASGVSAASVRRYLSGYEPPASFVAWAALERTVNPEFVLLGRGPACIDERDLETLRRLDTATILSILGDRLVRLEEGLCL